MEREFFTFLTSDGRELRLAHLTLYDIFGDPRKPEVNGFVPLYRQRKKRQMLDNCRLLEMDAGQTLTELMEFDNQPVGLETFLELIDNPAGRESVIEFSFTQANPGKPIAKVTGEDRKKLMGLMFAPLGIVFGEDADQIKNDDTSTFGDGGQVPNPPTPLALTGASGGETGSATSA